MAARMFSSTAHGSRPRSTSRTCAKAPRCNSTCGREKRGRRRSTSDCDNSTSRPRALGGGKLPQALLNGYDRPAPGLLAAPFQNSLEKVFDEGRETRALVSIGDLSDRFALCRVGMNHVGERAEAQSEDHRKGQLRDYFARLASPPPRSENYIAT